MGAVPRTAFIDPAGVILFHNHNHLAGQLDSTSQLSKVRVNMKDRFSKAFKKDKRSGKNAADSGSEANSVVELSRYGSQVRALSQRSSVQILVGFTNGNTSKQPIQSKGQGGGDVMPFVLGPSAALVRPYVLFSLTTSV